MRFTVAGLGDVEVPDGADLAACRAGLALLGGPALARAPLAVGPRVLTDDQVAGVLPWVEGCRVTLGRGAPDPVPAALAARWYLAVVGGPDAGLLAAPVAGAVTVGRGGPGPGRLALTDPGVSREHLVVRRRLGLWWVRDVRSTPLAALRPSLPLLGGGRVEVGGTVLRLGSAQSDLRSAPGRAAPGERPPGEVTATALLPAAGSVAMAAALGSPVLAAFGLLGLVPLLPRVTRRLRRARQRRPDAAALAVLAGAAAVPATDAAPADPLPRGDATAVTGPRDHALAAVRVLVGAALLDPEVHLELAVDPERAGDWEWCRWLGDRVRRAVPGRSALPARPPSATPATGATSADGTGPRRLLVVDGAPGALVHRWWADRPARSAAVVVASGDTPAPAWCTVVPADVAGTAGAGGARHAVPVAGRAWADDLGRRLAATARRDALPRVVPLAGLVAVESVAQRWAQGHGLAVPIGVHAGGEAWLDLADGPHVLVAGTTGAGKSELLQTLVLSLALHHPPERLALVLVDFKGGAGLGPCRDLPHVLGEVTDLDPAAADRALAGVRAELRRREALLAAAGVGDLEELRENGSAPPRLVVVVDELRALRDDLPDVLPALIRLAAQGRSLGIHLVLATQRPAGALDAQMRANVAIRVCLRVTDAGDSLDVIDDPGAAALPADHPGRALVRVGTAPPVAVQTAWAGAPRATRAVRWASHDWLRAPGTGAPSGAAGAASRRAPDATAEVVATIRTAALRRRRPPALWRPPLPTQLTLDEIDGHVGTAGVDRPAALPREREGAPRNEGGSRPGTHPGTAPRPLPGGRPGTTPPSGVHRLVWGLVDHPEEQRTAPGTWDLGSGPLLVAGGPGSGRTTALHTLAAAALAAGLPVHVLHSGVDRWLPSAWDASPGVGTVVGTDDPRRAVRLLDLLAASSGPALLLVDGVAAVQRACDLAPRGVGDVLAATLRHPRAGLAVAVGGLPAELARFAAGAGPRLVLGRCEDGALVGVTAGRRSAGSHPGRGLLITGTGTAVCQVALPPSSGPPRPAGGPGSAAADTVRLAQLPRTIRLAELGADPGVALGAGGDDGGPVVLDLCRGLLVVGPSRSGRSAALRRARAQAGAAEVATPATGRDLADVVARWARGPGGPRLLVVDDADVLVRDASVEATLVRWVQAVEAGDHDTPRVLASTRTDRAATAWSGLVAALRASAPVLVLGATTPGSSDAAGHDLARLCDPVRGSLPGRGVLVDRGVAVPLQVAL